MWSRSGLAFLQTCLQTCYIHFIPKITKNKFTVELPWLKYFQIQNSELSIENTKLHIFFYEALNFAPKIPNA